VTCMAMRASQALRDMHGHALHHKLYVTAMAMRAFCLLSQDSELAKCPESCLTPWALLLCAPAQDNNVELSIDKVRSEVEDYALRAYTMVSVC